MATPTVEIVVPAYNEANHLRECLESILKQSYTNWKAVVVNNCSTDDTAAIANEFATRDPRFRVLDCTEFVGQAENYNRALAQASPDSEYVNIVEADNWITPESIALKVALAETDPHIGMVGSYSLMGTAVIGGGLDYTTNVLDGAEVLRRFFRDGTYLFGTPTSLLCRTRALQEIRPWFRPGLFYDDADLCVRILQRWKFGFIPQLLAYQRTGNDGTLSRYRNFDYVPAFSYFLIEDYGRSFFAKSEFDTFRGDCERAYFEKLARAPWKKERRAYWTFHETAFKARGETLPKLRLLAPMLRGITDILFNPKATVERAWTRMFKAH